MSEPPSPSRLPAWLAPAVVILLSLQLVLAWMQGSMLHRQHQDLLDLRADVQDLTDTLEQSLSQDQDYQDSRSAIRHSRLLKVRRLQNPPPAEEEDPARKDVEQSRASGQQAVQDASKVKSQLSLEENARKAEEKAKLEGNRNTWQRWVVGAALLALLAWFSRSWLSRRG